jgi:hypothetical protein
MEKPKKRCKINSEERTAALVGIMVSTSRANNVQQPVPSSQQYNADEQPRSIEDIPLQLFRAALSDALFCGDLARLGRGITLAAAHGHGLAALLQNQSSINLLEEVLCDQISKLPANAPCEADESKVHRLDSDIKPS